MSLFSQSVNDGSKNYDLDLKVLDDYKNPPLDQANARKMENWKQLVAEWLKINFYHLYRKRYFCLRTEKF